MRSRVGLQRETNDREGRITAGQLECTEVFKVGGLLACRRGAQRGELRVKLLLGRVGGRSLDEQQTTDTCDDECGRHQEQDGNGQTSPHSALYPSR